ncbi:MAG: LysE family transporter [Synechococcaceae cyanobacterium SM2_3_60]|nr:LysE family transporter [Synechococcaceae cyanobacterium SM2_3_60]
MLTLFTALLLLAALPSTSVWLVVGHSLGGGIWQGLAVALGIVVADVLFIAIAIGGLSLVATALATWNDLIRSLSGIYLSVLGWQRLRSASKLPALSNPTSSKTMLASGLLGFSISLADQKALLFYFGFLPAFVQSAALQGLDIAIIMATAVIAIGGVKAIYALTATRLARQIQPKIQVQLQRLVGLMLGGVGGYLLISSVW